MGDFRIVINAVGNHGRDRDKKDGEIVDFECDGSHTPESIALDFIQALKDRGNVIESAYLIHWPDDNRGNLPDRKSEQIVDDLITGKRTGNF